jgi:DNA-binding MarR family transcriptional regulator
MMLAYLLSERLAEGAPATPALAAEVIESAVARTRAAHRALWGQLERHERVVLAAISDGTAPSSRALAAEHGLARSTLARASDRLAGQGHVVRDDHGSRVVDPLLREWLRRR